MRFAFHRRQDASSTSAGLASAGSVRTASARFASYLSRWWKQLSNTLKAAVLVEDIGMTGSKSSTNKPGRWNPITRAAIANAIQRKVLAAFSLLFLLASLPSLLSAQVGYPVSGQAVTPTGTPVYNAQLTLCSYTATGIPCTPQANMYSDAALTHLITQPYATNQYGNFNFWVAPNVSYLLQIKVSSTLVYSYYVGAGGTTPPVGLTIQTNSVNNLSQSLLNFTNGTGITVTNPSGGIEQFNCNTTGSAGAIGCSFIPLYGNGSPSASCSAGNVSQEYYDLTPSNSSPQIWICKQTGTGFAWQQLSNSTFPYPGAGVPLSTGSSWGTSFGVQGTDSNVLTSGTVSSSPGSLLCVDSNNGATTAGCAVPTGVTFQLNGSATGVNQAVWNANDSFPAPPSGNLNCTWQHDQATGSWSCYVPSILAPSLVMQNVPPVPGQYTIIYPTTGTITSDPPNQSGIYANGTSGAGGAFLWECSGLLCSTSGEVDANWSGFALPSWLAARTGDITAIYADAITTAIYPNLEWGYTDIYTHTSLTCNGGSQLMVSPTAYPYPATEVSSLTSLTGATFNSGAGCSIRVGGSGPGTHAQLVYVNAIRYFVYYTGTPGPDPNAGALQIQPPLQWNSSTNTLFLDQTQDLSAGHIRTAVVGTLPPASLFPYPGSIIWVNNGASSTDCTTGGGSTVVGCYSNGSNWVAIGGGGGVVYPGAGIPLSTGSAWGTSYAAQGTDTKLLTSGTVSGVGATLCTDANGGATTLGCSGGGGSSAWSALTNPTGNLSLSMGANTSTFTYGAALGTSDMWRLTDTASNTGTGILFHVTTASGSTEIPWQADANGTGWQVTAAGILQGVGSGTTHGITLTEGTPLSGVVGKDILTSDSTTHQLLKNPNNTGNQVLVGTSTTPAAVGHCAQYAANGFDITDAGAACGAGGGSAFSGLTGGTNTTAAMVVGSGASLAPTGTGTIQATNISGAIAAGTGTTITGSGTTASPYTIAVSGSGGSATVASAEVVAFSATPTFSASYNVSRIVLTGNITSFTMAAGTDGQSKTLCFQQGSGLYTVAAPAAVHGFFTIGNLNGGWNCQSFTYDNTDSIWLANSAGVVNQ